jgi:hypothetical protein
MAQIDIKNCTILIEDGAGHSLEVKIGEGNLTYSEKRNMLYTLNAGRLDEVREGDESPMDVKLDAVWEYISGGASSDGVPSVEDALKQRGAASGWTSTDSDTCRPYAVDLSIIYSPEPEGCGDEEDIVLADFRVEEYAHDLRAGTISISGKCNVIEAVATRVSPPVDDTLVMMTGFRFDMAGLNGKYIKAAGLYHGMPYWEHWLNSSAMRIAWFTGPGKYAATESADWDHETSYYSLRTGAGPIGTYETLLDETDNGTAAYADAADLAEVKAYMFGAVTCWVNQIDLETATDPGIVVGHQLKNSASTYFVDTLTDSKYISAATGVGTLSVTAANYPPPNRRYSILNVLIGNVTTCSVMMTRSTIP